MQGFTHYAVIDHNNDVVAVIKSKPSKEFKGKAIEVIEDETGSQVVEIRFDEVDMHNYKATAKLKDDNTYVAMLRPTWEY